MCSQRFSKLLRFGLYIFLHVAGWFLITRCDNALTRSLELSTETGSTDDFLRDFVGVEVVACALYLIVSFSSPGYAQPPTDSTRKEHGDVYWFQTAEGKEIAETAEEIAETAEGEEIADTAEGKEYRYGAYCLKCQFIRPPRSKHCYICGKCVLKKDHHCPIVNNCIGLKNHRHYMVFLLWHVAWIGWVLYTLVVGYLHSPQYDWNVYADYLLGRDEIDPLTWPQLWKRHFLPNPFGENVYNIYSVFGWPILASAFLALVEYWTITLVTFHCWLILTNQTTREVMRPDPEFHSKSSYFAANWRPDTFWSRGVVLDVWAFLTAGHQELITETRELNDQTRQNLIEQGHLKKSERSTPSNSADGPNVPTEGKKNK